jgi:predicted phosphohydrolase
MKVCAISDSHRQHWNIKVPNCDLFIFAGDAEINGVLPLHDFNDWLGTIKAPLGRIVIGGNHDGYLEFLGKKECKRLLTNCVYLENESIDVQDLTIFGSPYSPRFNDWSFMKYDGDLKKIWNTISNKSDIVITHCPCCGILDQVLPNDRSEGSLTLRDRIKEIRPRIHICGHIHEGFGRYTDGNTDYYNVSILDEMYKLINPVTMIEV